MKKRFALALALTLVLLAGCTDNQTASSTAAPAVPASTVTATESAPAATQTAPATESAPAETTAAPETAAVTEAPAIIDPQDTTKAATEASTEPDAQKVDPWSLMGELLSESGTYTDEFDYTDPYSYSLPMLKAETPDAIAINEEIDQIFGSSIREAKQAMKDHKSLILFSVNYTGEVWQDVLSLVVVSKWNSAFDQYGVYCYDAAEGRRLDTAALLEKMGIPQEAFLEACRVRFRSYFEDMYKDIPADQRENYGYYVALERVDSEEFVRLDLMAYPDANGDIVVIAPIVSLAGADFYYHPIHLGLNQG